MSRIPKRIWVVCPESNTYIVNKDNGVEYVLAGSEKRACIGELRKWADDEISSYPVYQLLMQKLEKMER